MKGIIMAVYLYAPTHKYRGLDPNCEEYLKLRIFYLNHYLDAIKEDNIWMERHYLKKILTGISYDNYPVSIVNGLESVFRKRAEWCSYYFTGFCEYIVRYDDLTDEEKKAFINHFVYEFRTCKGQESVYHGNLKNDLRRLFNLYKSNGFASQQDIARFKACSQLYNSCSKMESEMKDALQKLGYEDAEYEKTFSDLVGDKGLLRFDGCVTKNDQIILIECQGLQHYQAVDFFGGEEQLRKQQRYDELKRNYCIKNKIPLLLIRHNQSVRTTLKRFLARKTYNDIIYEYK